MGNICGKTEPEAFSSPGRTVGTAPGTAGQPQSSSIPPKARAAAKPKVGGPGRTLGGPEQDTEDARSKAAQAAEARAKAANKSGGKLQTQLAAQKKQTRTDTLKDASNQERLTREAEDAARTRNWD